MIDPSEPCTVARSPNNLPIRWGFVGGEGFVFCFFVVCLIYSELMQINKFTHRTVTPFQIHSHIHTHTDTHTHTPHQKKINTTQYFACFKLLSSSYHTNDFRSNQFFFSCAISWKYIHRFPAEHNSIELLTGVTKSLTQLYLFIHMCSMYNFNHQKRKIHIYGLHSMLTLILTDVTDSVENWFCRALMYIERFGAIF